MDFDKETATAPIHHHEEYEEHDWCLDEDGEIDISFGEEMHIGPMCKKCHYWFCIYCEPDGWNKPCVIDYSTCPRCGKQISVNYYCPNCGQKIDWSF